MTRPADTAANPAQSQDNGDRHGPAPLSSSTSPDTFTRTTNGQIITWPPGMEQRYGFPREQALGQISHRLLRTIFPAALRDIEATLLTEHRWRGGLIHRHACGKAIVVMSHWDLQPPTDGPRGAMVTEAHFDTISIQLADLLAILANELSQPLTAVSNYVNGARRSLQRDPPDQDIVRKAMAMAADQIVRSTEHVNLMRNLADDLRRMV